jgi:hypothetical protein
MSMTLNPNDTALVVTETTNDTALVAAETGWPGQTALAQALIVIPETVTTLNLGGATAQPPSSEGPVSSGSSLS